MSSHMVEWVVFIVMAFAIGIPMDMNLNVASFFIDSYAASLIAMMMFEVKNKACGDKFDWKDIKQECYFRIVWWFILLLWVLYNKYIIIIGLFLPYEGKTFN